MGKRFFFAWASIFVLWMIGSFVVHGSLLHDDYMQLPNLFRPEADAQRYLPLMIVAHVILSGAFVWIYSRGVEDKPWLMQGIRYGVAIALLTVVPTYIIYFVVQPMPGATVVRQIIFDGLLLAALGVAVAFAYRDRPRVPRIAAR
ncbi:MAG TPA: hypothetical protein VFO33_04865 [Casimicrobiaceae bacterium]|nr:hypothetical protein [Casimicrobiaceae bacterium]